MTVHKTDTPTGYQDDLALFLAEDTPQERSRLALASMALDLTDILYSHMRNAAEPVSIYLMLPAESNDDVADIALLLTYLRELRVQADAQRASHTPRYWILTAYQFPTAESDVAGGATVRHG